MPLCGTSGLIFSIATTEEGVACTFGGSYVRHGLLTNLITPPPSNSCCFLAGTSGFQHCTTGAELLPGPL